MKRFREGLVFKARRLVHHSTLGSRVIKKKRNKRLRLEDLEAPGRRGAPSEVAPAPPQLGAGPVPPDEIRFLIPAMRLEFIPEPGIEG